MAPLKGTLHRRLDLALKALLLLSAVCADADLVANHPTSLLEFQAYKTLDMSSCTPQGVSGPRLADCCPSRIVCADEVRSGQCCPLAQSVCCPGSGAGTQSHCCPSTHTCVNDASGSARCQLQAPRPAQQVSVTTTPLQTTSAPAPPPPPPPPPTTTQTNGVDDFDMKNMPSIEIHVDPEVHQNVNVHVMGKRRPTSGQGIINQTAPTPPSTIEETIPETLPAAVDLAQQQAQQADSSEMSDDDAQRLLDALSPDEVQQIKDAIAAQQAAQQETNAGSL